MYLIKENDVYRRESGERFSKEETITFKQPEPKVFPRYDYDWYIIVALEKSDKVMKDRHLLTSELLLSFRWAIREGYQHQLDPNLRREYDCPRIKSTVNAIQGYIDGIKKKQDAIAKANGFE